MKLTLTYRIGTVDDGKIIDGIYPVAMDEDGTIVAIFKYPSTPRNPGTLDGFKAELIKYGQAIDHPFFDRNKFGVWDYFNINGWEDIIVPDDILEDTLAYIAKSHAPEPTEVLEVVASPAA